MLRVSTLLALLLVLAAWKHGAFTAIQAAGVTVVTSAQTGQSAGVTVVTSAQTGQSSGLTVVTSQQ